MYDVKSCDSTTDASDALLLLVHVVQDLQALYPAAMLEGLFVSSAAA
jgi:hypothetical protein